MVNRYFQEFYLETSENLYSKIGSMGISDRWGVLSGLRPPNTPCLPHHPGNSHRAVKYTYISTGILGSVVWTMREVILIPGSTPPGLWVLIFIGEDITAVAEGLLYAIRQARAREYILRRAGYCMD
jgi:hypothetical protein